MLFRSGDSVLSIVIAQKLYEQYPDVAESDLSRMRAATVSQQPLAAAARRIGLGDFLFLGKGESMHGGRDLSILNIPVFPFYILKTFPIAAVPHYLHLCLYRPLFLPLFYLDFLTVHKSCLTELWLHLYREL